MISRAPFQRPAPASTGFALRVILALLLPLLSAQATPANKSALEKHYDRFLAKELHRCTTCHLPSDKKSPESLEEFPHNPFGHRLRELGERSSATQAKRDIVSRLTVIAREDSDGDGVDNETELLLGRNPGDARDTPSGKQLDEALARRREFATFLSSYRWQPFETVQRPPVPRTKNQRWSRNPIDTFIAAGREEHQLRPRPEAPREILLRRVYLDLIGLAPTPEEQRAFLADRSPDAYEKVVDRLLGDPRHGERWGRHWMDVWRYSDWAGWADGGQVRDSKPHIWRWRDWIVESLNTGKPYDRMLLEMLAADELAPEDTNALRATGFLVRNYKMLSREQWLEDTVKHTSQAFLGVTVGCAKCHDHMVDPISQKEYYQIRAIFEPHQVRTDKVPGQTNTTLDGLVRVFDVGTNAPTWLLNRGDERHPDTNHVIQPGVPAAFGGSLSIASVALPHFAAFPDKREHVVRDTIAASEKALADARRALEKLQTNTSATPAKRTEHELTVSIAQARHESLLAIIQAEHLEDSGRKDTGEWKHAATNALLAQRTLKLAEATLKKHSAQAALTEAQTKLDQAKSVTNSTEKATAKATTELEAAQKKADEAIKALAATAQENQSAVTNIAYQPRPTETFPATSTGRRLAFARWLADAKNPLTARVAVNHIWLRHFGRGLVPTPADFGHNGRPPSHPQLLDWLASEFVAQGWDMKAMHRLMVTSSTYRMASTPVDASAAIDPDNTYLWRMNSRRLEAEVVRDNLLYVSGSLDLTQGGPDIDHQLGLTSKRRSIYLRSAAEKEVEFLKIFDGPSITECYERKPSVVPQQALALANSELALGLARRLARELSTDAGADDTAFTKRVFSRVLARQPTRLEAHHCEEFLSRPSSAPITAVTHQTTDKPSADPVQRARENLVLVLMNHNDFVTVR